MLTIVARLRSLVEGAADAAALVVKGTDGPDPLIGSGSFRLDATTNPAFSVAHDAGVVCASVPLAN